jgi:hypothetical protein
VTLSSISFGGPGGGKGSLAYLKDEFTGRYNQALLKENLN